MVELLCAADDRLEASRVDRPRADGSPNFTIDTLRYLRRLFSPEDELFNIVGVDAFRDLPRWRDPQQLLITCDWIVVSRPGIKTLEVIDQVAPGDVRSHIHALGGISNQTSATEIRRRLALQEPCDDLLPADVLAYIGRHDLYHSSPLDL